MPSLSQALHLGDLPFPHSAFQDHATHTVGWPRRLGPTTQGEWVGTGRVALRYVSPCPPLDPYVRLSPHTAHDRGILRERSISPAPRSLHRGQLCAFAGYLCTVSPPSPSGPSPSVLVLVYPAFLGSDYYALFDCLEGLGGFGSGLPYLLPPSFTSLTRLSRVHNRGLKQDGVGGVLLSVPSALC